MRGCNRGEGDVWYVGGMRVVSSMWEVSRGEWYVGPCTICFFFWLIMQFPNTQGHSPLEKAFQEMKILSLL